MIKAPSKILSITVAVIFAGALFVTANARMRVAAHPTRASLPTVRLDYLESSKLKLAKTLDPAIVTSATAADIIALVQANLIAIDPTNKIKNQLAQKYTVSKNHKVYTFYIKPNARYSDGRHVTAADIKASILEASAPSTHSPVADAYMFAIVGETAYNSGKATGISGLKVLGPRVLRVTIVKPYQYFLKAFTYPTSDAINQAVMKGATRTSTGNTLTTNCAKNVGAGPYKFKCYGTSFYPAGQTPSYSLVPNPYYFGRKPHVNLYIQAYSDLDTGYKSFNSGGPLDTTGIPSGFVNGELARNRKLVVAWGTSIVTYITPNSKMAPFTDKNCRLAVAYSIDRVTYRKILHNLPNLLYDVVPKGFLGYYSGKNNPHFNLKKAKSYFAKCGPRNTPVKFVYPTGSSDLDASGNYIVNSMRRAGFNVTGDAKSENDWLGIVSSSLQDSHTQIVKNGWQQDYPDPQDYVELLLRCGQNYDIGGYCSGKFDKLSDRANVEPNAKKRAALYVQAQHVAIADGAWITISNAVGHERLKACVHGLVGTVAYADLVPKGYDWANVTKSGKC